jgi:hypothetical protein
MFVEGPLRAVRAETLNLISQIDSEATPQPVIVPCLAWIGWSRSPDGLDLEQALAFKRKKAVA